MGGGGTNTLYSNSKLLKICEGAPIVKSKDFTRTMTFKNLGSTCPSGPYDSRFNDSHAQYYSTRSVSASIYSM